MEIKNKEGLLPAAWAAGLSQPGQNGMSHKHGGEVGQPSAAGDLVPPRNPSLQILFLFHSEIKTGLTVKWQGSWN